MYLPTLIISHLNFNLSNFSFVNSRVLLDLRGLCAVAIICNYSRLNAQAHCERTKFKRFCLSFSNAKRRKTTNFLLRFAKTRPNLHSNGIFGKSNTRNLIWKLWISIGSWMALVSIASLPSFTNFIYWCISVLPDVNLFCTYIFLWMKFKIFFISTLRFVPQSSHRSTLFLIHYSSLTNTNKLSQV